MIQCVTWAKNLGTYMYSISSLETTIFCQIVSLVRVNFRLTFLSSCLTPYLYTLLPPIRVKISGINLRKVRLKNFLFSWNIVVSGVETLYIYSVSRKKLLTIYLANIFIFYWLNENDKVHSLRLWKLESDWKQVLMKLNELT